MIPKFDINVLKKINLIIFLILIFTLILGVSVKANKVGTLKDNLIANLYPSPTPVPTATPTPTPTSTPTPTITPTPTFTGFCVTAPILMYHHVEPAGQAGTHAGLSVSLEMFENQMKYLNDQGYKTISVQELINDLVNNVSPGKVAVVTLDDGYVDNYAFAYPIAKKLGIKINIMLATGLMENPEFLTWGQVKEVADSGMVSFGNHTWSHFSLPNGSDEKIKSEIETSQTQINDHLGYRPSFIAWPWGSYDNRTINAARAAGISSGFSTIAGTIQCDSFLWGLHRSRIGNSSLAAYGI